jgi:hypothetical protein
MKTRPFVVLLGLNLGAVASFAHSPDSTLQLSTVPVWSQTAATQSVVSQPDAYGLWASGADIRMTSPGGSLLLSRDGYPTAYVQGSWEGLPLLTPDLGVADFSLLPHWGQQRTWGSPLASQYQSGQALGELLDVRGQSKDLLELKGSSLKGAGIGGIWTLSNGPNGTIRMGGGTEAWKNDYRFGDAGMRRNGADGSRHELFLTQQRNYSGGRWSTGGTGYVVSADRGLPASIYDLEGTPARQQDLRAQVSTYQSYHFEHLHFRTEQVLWSQDQFYQGPWYSDTNASQGAYIRFYTGTHWKNWKLYNEETVGVNRMNGAFKPDVTIDYVTLNLLAESPMTRLGKFTLGAKWSTWGRKKSPLAPQILWEKRMQTWTLYGHLRQMFRFPTMNDLFWTGFGNPDLDPERGWEAQGGLRKSFQQGYLDAQVFSTQLQQAIIWLPDDFGNWRPVNQSSWDRQGAKLTGHYALGSWILDANLRYVHVTDEEGNLAPYVAPWLGAAGFARRWGKGEWGATWTAQSAVPTYWVAPGSGPEAYLAGQSAVAVRFAREFTETLKAQISVENLFNQTMVFQPGYPMPGRYLHMRFSYAL